MTEEAAVDEAALDNPDPGCHAQTADEFETGNKTGEQVRAGDRAPGDVGRGERGRYDRDPGMQDRSVVRVVVVARMRHDAVEPRGVMGRQSCIRAPEGRLSPPAPNERQDAQLANARSLAPRSGTGSRRGEVVERGHYDEAR